MRKGWWASDAALVAMLAMGPALAASPPLPKEPVAISVIDVGGALALIQKGFEAYRAKNPKPVSRIALIKVGASKLK
jgi:putative spermidine/putrescine transport system substrate-binding protein